MSGNFHFNLDCFLNFWTMIFLCNFSSPRILQMHLFFQCFYLTLMNCSPPGSSDNGILQARILAWVAIPFSRGSSWPRDWTWVSCLAGVMRAHCIVQGTLFSALWWPKGRQILHHLSHQGSPKFSNILVILTIPWISFPVCSPKALCPVSLVLIDL